MAVIFDLTEQKRVQANLSAIKRYIFRTDSSIRNSLDRMMDSGLVDTDSDTDKGWRKFYYLTDHAYFLLEQFRHAVNDEQSAHPFYSNQYKRMDA